ncbi:hypothetical protein ATY30_28765 [Sinorhizobium americanum]|nr:hypothetical protein ATY30_28765 [Sinorhizobium americanum]
MTGRTSYPAQETSDQLGRITNSEFLDHVCAVDFNCPWGTANRPCHFFTCEAIDEITRNSGFCGGEPVTVAMFYGHGAIRPDSQFLWIILLYRCSMRFHPDDLSVLPTHEAGIAVDRMGLHRATSLLSDDLVISWAGIQYPHRLSLNLVNRPAENGFNAMTGAQDDALRQDKCRVGRVEEADAFKIAQGWRFQRP